MDFFSSQLIAHTNRKLPNRLTLQGFFSRKVTGGGGGGAKLRLCLLAFFSEYH